MSFIWNVHQSGQIAEAKTDAVEAKVRSVENSDRVRSLELQVQHMALACQAMWELLRERVGITEQELLAKISEVDLRDGTKDGRITTVQTSCPSCGKPSNSKNFVCIYCGATLPKRHVFE